MRTSKVLQQLNELVTEFDYDELRLVLSEELMNCLKELSAPDLAHLPNLKVRGESRFAALPAFILAKCPPLGFDLAWKLGTE